MKQTNLQNILPYVMMLVGVCLGLFFYMIIQKHDDISIVKNFEGISENYIYKLTRELHSAEIAADTLRHMFDSSEFVSRSEFRHMAQHLIKKHDVISAIAWMPKVTPKNYENTYAQVNKDCGKNKFQLNSSEFQNNSENEDSLHFPIFYYESDLGEIECSHSVFGTDLYALPEQEKAIGAALASGLEVQATDVINIIEGEARARGLSIFAATIGSDKFQLSATLDDISGMVNVIIRFDDMIDRVFEAIPQGYQVHIQDITNQITPKTFLVINPHQFLKPNFQTQNYIEFANRVWRIKLSMSREAYNTHKSALPQIIFLLTVIFALISAYLYRAGLIRTQKMKQRVNQKAKELEIQRLKSLHASRLSVLGEMATNIIFEINGPLSVIVGTTEMLKHSIEKDTPAAIKEQLLKIEGSAERIKNITEDLKEFSKTSDSKQKTKHSIEAIINKILNITNHTISRNNIILEKEIETRSYVLCNHIEIEQAIINLIINAIDAVKETEKAWIKVSAHDDEKMVKICITDSGHGILEEDIPNLFNPFFSKKNDGNGAGLGLSIAQEIIEDHKGFLTYNEQAQNTSFVIELDILSQ